MVANNNILRRCVWTRGGGGLKIIFGLDNVNVAAQNKVASLCATSSSL